jgi:hypothetical protein
MVSRYAIKIDFSYVEWEGVAWIHLAQSTDNWQVLLNTVMNFRVLRGGAEETHVFHIRIT